MPKQGSKERPHIGQGRAGSKIKRPDPINQSINQPSNLSWKIPGRTEIKSGKTNHVHTKDLIHSINNVSGKMPDVPFLPSPVCKLLPKPTKQDMSYPQGSQSSTSIEDIDPNINFDFEENSQFKKVLCPKHFRGCTSHFSKNQRNWGTL